MPSLQTIARQIENFSHFAPCAIDERILLSRTSAQPKTDSQGSLAYSINTPYTWKNMATLDWTYPLACVWGLVAVIALAGWGKLFGYVLRVPGESKTFPLGMASACGMAIFIFLSGALLLCDCFSKIFVVLFLVLGLCFMGGGMFGKRAGFNFTWPKRWFLWVLCGLATLMIGISYAYGVARHDYNDCDDFPAYFTYPKMMLDTGTFLDPFSFRRMSALGGQSALQTLTLAFLPWKYGNLLDRGIALLILLALVHELIAGNSTRAYLTRLCLVVLALTFPVPRLNTTSELTGVVLLLALLRAFDLVTEKALSGWNGPLLIGALAGATATLRAQNLYAVGILLLGYFSWRLWDGRRQPVPVRNQALMTFAAIGLFLLPWLIVSQLSSGTFLYPLIRGNQQAGFAPFSANFSAFAFLSFVGGFFFLTNYLLFFYPVCLIAPGRIRQVVLVIALCLLALSIAMVAKFTSSDYPDLYRYLMPLGFGFFLYMCGIVGRQVVAAESGTGWSVWPPRVIIACLSAALLVGYQGLIFKRAIPQLIGMIQTSFTTNYPFTVWPDIVVRSIDNVSKDYAQGMSRIPPGSKVLIAVDYPFLLNYRTQHLYNIDEAGAASPKPGLPYFQGSAAVKSYLQGLGITYIAYVPFDHSIYLHGLKKELGFLNGPVPLYHYTATFELDFMKNVNDLALSNQLIYQSDTIRVMSLQ